MIRAMSSRRRASARREENELEFSRIVAFSDGVFAIAITLLVLQSTSPRTSHGQRPGHRHSTSTATIAYALSFAVIGRFWLVHHRFFGDIAGFDSRLMALNLFYLGLDRADPLRSQILGEFGDDSPRSSSTRPTSRGVTLVGSG